MQIVGHQNKPLKLCLNFIAFTADNTLTHLTRCRGLKLHAQHAEATLARRSRNADSGLADLKHRGNICCWSNRRLGCYRSHQPPSGVVCGMNFGWFGCAQAAAGRTAALDGGQRHPHGRFICNRQVVDRNAAWANLIQCHIAIWAAGLTAAITTHRNLHSDSFHENLLHNAPGDPE